MKLSEVNTDFEFFIWSYETDPGIKRKELMSISFSDYAHNLKLVGQFLYACMLYGPDYDDERRVWLEKNRKFIDEHHEKLGYTSDEVFKCFEQMCNSNNYS